MSTQTHNRQVAAPQATGTIKHSGLLHDLRALVPNLRISHIEALRITEHQASALRRSLDAREDYFETDLVGDIPRIRIQSVDDLPARGASFWGHASWHIHIRAQEPAPERRFTILHELKHVIDHPTQHLIYDERALVSYGERELIADYFARCVLIPASRLRRLYATTTDRGLLTAHFGVTQRVLQQRLSDIGLSAGAPEPADPQVASVVEATCARRAA